MEGALETAIRSLPWERDVGNWLAFCGEDTRCDTLQVDPRVVLLPAQLPTFFVPAARPLYLDLSDSARRAKLDVGRPVRYADWESCLESRLTPEWRRARVACVAMGIGAPYSPSDTVNLALLVVTPGRGLVWPHFQLVTRGARWRVERAWMGSEAGVMPLTLEGRDLLPEHPERQIDRSPVRAEREGGEPQGKATVQHGR
jgi:hypothetical protein